jgi:hypothetical protein
MDFSECLQLTRAVDATCFPGVEHAMAFLCTRDADSVTERYVASEVEGLDVIDTDVTNLQPLMEELARARVVAPVTPDDIEAAMARVEGMYRTMYKRTGNFMPRCLKTLNGGQYRLVPTGIVKEAMEREKAMAGMTHGWGVCDPPPYAVAHRLLVSSGLDPRRLPAYPTLSPKHRGRLMCAWAGACARLGWRHYEPKADVSSQARAKKLLAEFVAKGGADDSRDGARPWPSTRPTVA